MYIKIGTTKRGKNNENNKKQSNWYHQTKNIGIITYIVMEGKCI